MRLMKRVVLSPETTSDLSSDAEADCAVVQDCIVFLNARLAVSQRPEEREAIRRIRARAEAEIHDRRSQPRN